MNNPDRFSSALVSFAAPKIRKFRINGKRIKEDWENFWFNKYLIFKGMHGAKGMVHGKKGLGFWI